MSPQERALRVALARAPGIGPVTVRKVLARFGKDLEQAMARADHTAAALRLTQSAAEGLRRAADPGAHDEAQRVLEDASKLGVNVVVLGDEHFPFRLNEIRDAPILLFVCGNADALNCEHAVAIVGTRQPSDGSLALSQRLAADAARKGVAVISGLAAGIDAAAHVAALDSGGMTVAVLAGGAEMAYPPEHAELHARIAEHGATISEQAPGTRTESGLLVRRNRWIAALSDSVLVIEAGTSSGALHAASAALEYERALLVTQPEDDPRYLGNARLLEQPGARPLQPDATTLPEVPR